MRSNPALAAFLLVLAVCNINFVRAASPITAPTTAPSSRADDVANEPTPTVPLPPGMTPLFDGKSLDGWTQIPADTWTVKDGAIASLGAGRGVIYTNAQYDRYRIIFDMRHVSGDPKHEHQACVLVFCTQPIEEQKPLDALGGIQFQVPNGGHWDYRPGHNNAGKDEFTSPPHDRLNNHHWSRIEILVDASKGTARMAVAQPPGSKAVEFLDFNLPEAGRKGPFALQMHNKGLIDWYANIAIEENPTNDELITTK